jgi:hypothetical protein
MSVCITRCILLPSGKSVGLSCATQHNGNNQYSVYASHFAIGLYTEIKGNDQGYRNIEKFLKSGHSVAR